MSQTVLWAVLLVLAAVGAGQGPSASARDRGEKPAVRDLLAEHRKWLDEVRRHLFRREPVPFSRFDDMFGEDFFGPGDDPFREMEGFRRRMRALLGEAERPLFSRSWDDWSESRMNVASMRPELKTTEDEVILAIKVPGLDGESLSIDVNEDRIRVSYDAKIVRDDKDEKGGAYFKSESAQHFEKVMPIPEGADAKDNRIVREGDTVRIIFKKVRGRGGKA